MNSNLQSKGLLAQASRLAWPRLNFHFLQLSIAGMNRLTRLLPLQAQIILFSLHFAQLVSSND